jgi:Right handed beta helix region
VHQQLVEEFFMLSMIQTIARLVSVVAAITGCLIVAPAAVASGPTIAFVSSTGSGSSCTAAQPCATVLAALEVLSGGGGIVSCVNGTGPQVDADGLGLAVSNLLISVDCPGGTWTTFSTNPFALSLPGANQTIKIRHLTFNLVDSSSGAPAIQVLGSGNLILEDCVFENGSGAALDIEPSGPLNLVIKNSRMSNGGSGILLRPQSGGSINATLDHVTITQNAGGGIKADTTHGAITLDITDSVISNNGGNGVNAVGNAGNQNIVSIKNGVIAKNGAAGVQANGAMPR